MSTQDSESPPGCSNNEAVYFPGLMLGSARWSPIHVRNLLIATWHLMISGRTFIEDAEAAVGSPEYLLMLKMGLAETVFSIDCLLKGAEPPYDVHRLALFYELGLSEVLDASPVEAQCLLALDRNDGGRDEFDDIERFWNELHDAFPAELPNPLVAGGQADLLRTLRAWSTILEVCEIDGSFLSKLFKSL